MDDLIFDNIESIPNDMYACSNDKYRHEWRWNFHRF